MNRPYHFRPLQTFEEPQTLSTYMEGLLYTVRPGNDLLHGLVQGWLEEKKVELVEPQSRVAGSGLVK